MRRRIFCKNVIGKVCAVAYFPETGSGKYAGSHTLVKFVRGSMRHRILCKDIIRKVCVVAYFPETGFGKYAGSHTL